MSAGKAFFDTNVLLYMYGADAAKRERAQGLFRSHAHSGSLLISTQVVQEFFAAGSRKLRIPSADLRTLVSALLRLPLVVIDRPQIEMAISKETEHGISFWDSLIIAAADSGGAEVLYTEDLNHGQRYGTVLAQNPFR